MKLTGQQLQDIVFDYDDEWEEVEGTSQIVDQGRWSTHHFGVFKHLPSGKCYGIAYSAGSTESQFEDPFEYELKDEFDLQEYEQREVTELKWVPK